MSRRAASLWVILSFGCGFLAAAGFQTAWMPGLGQWVRDFSMSPALAGVGAIGAAIIAFRGIKHQAAASLKSARTAAGSAREALEHSRNNADLNRERQLRLDEYAAWWKSFNWFDSQMRGLKGSSVSVPARKLTAVVTELMKRATEDAQRVACSGYMDALAAVVAAEVSGSGEEGVPSAEQRSEDVVDSSDSEKSDGSKAFLSLYDASLSALREYAKASSGTAAASSGVASLLYKQDVLREIGRRYGFHRPTGEGEPDVIVRFHGGEDVRISAVSSDNPIDLPRMVLDEVLRVGGAMPYLAPHVVVHPTVDTPWSHDFGENVHVVSWDSEADTSRLHDEISRASRSAA